MPPFLVYDLCVIRLLVSLLLICSPLSAQIRFRQIDESIVIERLKSAPRKNDERQQKLANMFSDVGCLPVLQPVQHTKSSNVVCVLKGATDDVIIVGGHLDHVSAGDGIIDDWSGASLLPTLYESLKDIPQKHTFVFVGFTEEEK